MKNSAIPCHGDQSGAALLVALIMLIVITLIGVSAARIQTTEVRMTSNMHFRNQAIQSAEAGLRTGENGIEHDIYVSFAGNTSGQYTFKPSVTTTNCTLTPSAPWYLCPAVWNTASAVLNGPTLASDSLQPSAFIIEQLPPVAIAGGGLCNRSNCPSPTAVYRITAKAVGADGTANITLQSVFH